MNKKHAGISQEDQVVQMPQLMEGSNTEASPDTSPSGADVVDRGSTAGWIRQWELGEALFQEERYGEAVRIWERLLSQERSRGNQDPEKLRARLAEAYFRESRRLEPLNGDRRSALKAVQLLEKATDLDTKHPDYPYWCGVIHRRYGLWEKAARYLRTALDRDEGHEWSRVELTWANIQLGNAEEARHLLDTFADGSLVQVPAGLWQRLRAILNAKDGQAWEAFQSYPRTVPDHLSITDWWQELLNLARAAGREHPPEVLDELESLLPNVEMLSGSNSDKPSTIDLSPLWDLMGTLAIDAGEEEKAWHYWEHVPKASQFYSEIQAKRVRLLDRRGLLAHRDGRLDEAVHAWTNALAEGGGDGRMKRRLAHALLARGQQAWEDGQIEDAVATWTKATQQAPELGAAWYNLSLAHEQLSKWLQANEYWEEYLRRAGKEESGAGEPAVAADKQLVLRVAFNFVRAGRANEALKYMTRIQDEIVSHPRYLTLAALLHLQSGNGPKSLDLLERVLRMTSSDDTASTPDETAIQGFIWAARTNEVPSERVTGLAHELLGQLPPDGLTFRYLRQQLLRAGRNAWEAGALDKAMESFSTVLLANPADVEAWLWCGSVHMKANNKEGCDDCFAEAIRLDPQRVDTYVYVGARFLAAGDLTRAESYFGEALRIHQDPEIRVVIGEACAEIGVPDWAEDHFRAALADGNGDPQLVLRAVCSLLQAGYEKRVGPLLEQAYSLAPNIAQVRLLLAGQHIRKRQWQDAEEQLSAARQLISAQGIDNVLHYVTFLHNSMILLRTVGEINEEVFKRNIQAIITDWIASTKMPSPEEEKLESVEDLIASLVPESKQGDCWVPPLDGGSEDDDETAPDAGHLDINLFLNVGLPIPATDSDTERNGVS